LFHVSKVGRIIGEATGGNQQGINGGQFFFLNLSYSKIEIDIPLTWGAYGGERPDTGIVPDKIIRTTRASIASGKDPQLDAALNTQKGEKKYIDTPHFVVDKQLTAKCTLRDATLKQIINKTLDD